MNRFYLANFYRWFAQHMPTALTEHYGPWRMSWAQWLLLLLVTLFFVGITYWVVRLIVSVVRHSMLGCIEPGHWRLLGRLSWPVTLVLALLFSWFSFEGLELGYYSEHRLDSAINVLLALAGFWTLWCLIDVIWLAISESEWVAERPSSRGMLVLTVRFLKLNIVFWTLLLVFQKLGYSITGIITGLGIGGLAVALAAQKTLENMLGSLMLSLDQPFRIGDYVRIGDVTGHIENIGLRSTRIRTLDRTVITLPNAKLADMQIETYAARDRLRLFLILHLAYSTPATCVTAVIAQLKAHFQTEPLVLEESVHVHLIKLSGTAIDVEVSALFNTTDIAVLRAIRERFLLQTLVIVRDQGGQFLGETAASALSQRI